MTTWDEEALKHLPTVARGEQPPRYAAQGGIDEFNARMAERKAGMSLEAVMQQMSATHGRLLAYIRGVSEDTLANRERFVRRLRLDTYGHYRLHAGAIRAWRAHDL